MARKRVAVVAVPDVADQKPFDAAKRGSGVLSRVRAAAETTGELDPAPNYAATGQTLLQIPVAPIRNGGEFQVAAEKSPRSFRDWIRSRRFLPKALSKEYRVENGAPVEIAMMREAIAGYEPSPEESTYESLRIEMARTEPGPYAQSASVHVHELFWADLARAKHAAFRGLKDLFLLLFFFCGLGGLAAAFGGSKRDAEESGAQKTLRFFAGFTERLLVLAAPSLVLALLANLLTAEVFSWVSAVPGLPAMLLGIGVGVISAAVMRYSTGRIWLERYTWVWLIILLIAAAFGGVFGFWFRGFDRFTAWALIASLGLVFVVGAVLLLIVLNRRRPGALEIGSLILIIVGSLFCWNLANVGSGSQDLGGAWAKTATARTLVTSLSCLFWALWIVIAVSIVLSSLFGIFVAHFSGLKGGARRSAIRAVRTMAMAQTFSAALIFVATAALWQLLALFSPALAPAFLAGAPPGISILVIGFIVAAFIAGWLFKQAGLLERPPKDVLAAIAEDRSALAGSLTSALQKSGLPTLLVFLIITVGIFGSAVVRFSPEYEAQLNLAIAGESAGGWPAILMIVDRWATFLAGAVLFCSIVLSRGPLRRISLGTRAAVDIASEPANWLRVHPRGRTPRATISARFASVLRHLCEWREEDGSGYDGIVIMAHGHGSAISAEILRYLNFEWNKRHAAGQIWEPILGRIFNPADPNYLPLYFFTQGCPLRQLHAMRFPVLYRWVTERESTVELPAAAGAQPGPEPAELGLTYWSNVYRPGDYVGRNLWEVTGGDPWSGEWRVPAPNARERCIAVGAHRRYWDSTAPEVAIELERLISYVILWRRENVSPTLF
jgi:hypothetical protein